jgi:PAS domain S-box-containing protein
VAAILASAVAMFVTSRQTMGPSRAAFGSIVMGCGIASMHYIGMAAMRLPATRHYSVWLVVLSVVLAIGISFVALWLTFELRDDIHHLTWRRVNSAIAMGLAIPIMHYTGMAAASFTPLSSPVPDLSGAVSISALGTLGIIAVTFMVLGLAIVTSLVDRRFSAQMLREDILLREREARLREDADRREFILSAAGIGMWEYDLTSSAIEWSNTMEVIYGRPRAGFPKTLESFLTLVHPEDRSSVLEGFRQFLQDGTQYTKEFRVVWPDGSEHWLESTARVRRDSGGRATFVFGVDRDITTRRLLEDQFRQAQKMDAIGQLAGGVAHDFNNLLTAIVGFSDLILERPQSDGAVRADVEEILKAAHSASALTRQLLAFSRRQTLDPQILNLNDIIAGMEAMMRRLIGEHIELVTAFSESGCSVSADKGQIEQVVMNLALNARDAMPAGGTLRIDTSSVDLDSAFAVQHPEAAPGRYVRIAVKDTGVGMGARVRAHLFEPFFTTKDPGTGTGLGLATVYGIVKQSHGFLTVESELGAGSTFNVYLPEIWNTAPGAAFRGGPTMMRGTETILLVEDQAEVRRITSEALARHGYTVLTANNAAEGLAVLARESGQVDLLLTDVIMPGMDGRELGRRTATFYPQISVLYMSGYAHVIADANGVLEPGLAFLQKPFTISDLLQKVRLTLTAKSSEIKTLQS